MEETKQQEKNYTVKDLKDGKYELNFTISKTVFETTYKSLLEKSAKDVEVKGFRKGKVPASVVEEKYKQPLLIEAFEKLASNYVWIAVSNEKIDPIVPVKYEDLPKLDLGIDIEFKVIIVSIPKFELADIKKIAVEKQKVEVTEKEMQDTLDEMFKNQKTEEKEINDKWATQIAAKYGMKGVTDLAKMKEELKNLLLKQKGQIVENELNRGILREAIKIAKIQVPKEAVDYETHEREHSFEHKLEESKISKEDYLREYDTTMEKLQEIWEKDSKQAIEEHVYLVEYAKQTKIEVKEEEFIQFLTQAQPTKEMLQNKQWIDSMYGLMFKNKAFSTLVNEVKKNLGIDASVEKKKIELVG